MFENLGLGLGMWALGLMERDVGVALLEMVMGLHWK